MKNFKRLNWCNLKVLKLWVVKLFVQHYAYDDGKNNLLSFGNVPGVGMYRKR